MKKTLILASLLAFTMTSAFANEPTKSISVDGKRPPIERKYQGQPKFDKEKMIQKQAEFEAKLKLTDEQKAQAKEIGSIFKIRKYKV